MNTTLPKGAGYFVSVRAENSDGSSSFSTPRLLVVPPVSEVPSAEQVIQNYARNVVFNTYSDLAEQANALRAATVELQFDATDKSLK